MFTLYVRSNVDKNYLLKSNGGKILTEPGIEAGTTAIKNAGALTVLPCRHKTRTSLLSFLYTLT